LRIEQFQSSEFLNEATRESILSAAAPLPSEVKPAIPDLAILFRILATFEFIGGLILCSLLWPGDAGESYNWKFVAYVPAVTWLVAV